MGRTVECGICLEEYQEEELEKHREMCMAQLMFRCTICDGDYVSKEGLWNHLDLHEIADESKELHYQEMRATVKLHQCTLCNDHRGYQDNLYRRHVHEKHDGFFLWDSECGESFRSHKLKTGHDLTHSKVREQTVTSGLEAEQEFSNIVLPKMELLQEELSNVPEKESKCSEINIVDQQNTLMQKNINVPRSEKLLPAYINVVGRAGNNMTEKESEVHPLAISKSRSESKVDAEKLLQPLVENKSSGSSDINKSFSCEVCGHKFKKLASVNMHIIRVHNKVGDLRNIQDDLMSRKNQQELNQAEEIYLKMEIAVEETTLLQQDVFEISTLNQTTGTDFPDFGHHFKDQKVENSEPTSVDSSGQKSALNQERKTNTLENSNVADDTDINMSDKEFEVLLSAGLTGRNEAKMVAGKNLQSLVENPLAGTAEAKSYPCPICGITFFNHHQARYHKMKAHSEPKHKCPHCPRKFHQINDHQKHLSVCVSRGVRCDICGIKFKNLRNANFHKKQTHNVDKVLRKAQINQKCGSQQQEMNNSEQSLEDCSEQNPAVTRAKRAGKRKDAEPLTNNLSSVASETKCCHCEKVFVSVKSLSYHIDNCHKPSTCNICGKLFPSKDKARYHQTYKCVNCPKKFPNNGERRIECKLCGQMLKHLASLKRHMRRVHHVVGDLNKVLTDDRGKSMPNLSTIIDCPDMRQHAEVQEIVDSAPSTVNYSGQISALAQEKRSNTHKDIDSPNTFTSSDREEINSRFIENSPTISNSASDNVAENKSKKHTITSMRGSIELNVMAENTLQPLVENPLCGLSNTKCAQCGKECSSHVTLARHIEMIHVPHTCDICGINFSSYVKARYHKVTKHMEAKHKCPHCPKKFRYEKLYQMHLSYCESKKFSCDLCDQKFKASKYVVRHMREVHKFEGALKSVLIDRIDCHEENGKKQVGRITVERENSVEETTSNPFVIIDCSICGEHFGDQIQVSHHIEATHQMTMCASCGMTFASADQLNDHKLTCPHHIKQVDSQQTSEETSKPHDETSSSGLSRTVCPHCNKDCYHEALLARHIALHHQPVVCATCGNTVSGKYRLKYHKMKYHSEPKFKCPHCSKTFHWKNDYLRHVSNHENDIQFPCKLCDRKFKNVFAVKDHMRRTHSMAKYQTDHTDCNELKQEPMPSDDENLIQSENIELQMEIKVEETTLQEQEYQYPDEDRGKSPTITIISASQLKTRKTRQRVKSNFSCKKCHQTFHELRGFQAHVNKHMKENDRNESDEINEQMNACSICGDTFGNRRKLEYHKRVSHTERKYKCTLCPLTFHFGGLLRRHEKIHKKTTCKLCSQTFHDELSLERHLSSAHSCAELVCHKCNLKFTSLQKFNFHMKKFHTEPRFKCKHCGKLYDMKIAFQNHMVVCLKAKRKKVRKNKATAEQHIEDDLEQNKNSSLKNVKSKRSDHGNEIEINEEQSQMCSICELIISGNMQYHKLTAHTEPKHKCSHCSKVFYSISKLKRHETIHNKILEGNLECKLCSKTFMGEYNLQRHVRFIHPPSELPCGMCDLKFPTQRKLYYHMNTIHKSRFKCPECDKPFHTRYALQKHMDVHSKAT